MRELLALVSSISQSVSLCRPIDGDALAPAVLSDVWPGLAVPLAATSGDPGRPYRPATSLPTGPLLWLAPFLYVCSCGCCRISSQENFQ
jgi:hypothetical protein